MRRRVSQKKNRRMRTFRLVLLFGLLLPVLFIVIVSTVGSQKFGSLHTFAFDTAVGPLLNYGRTAIAYIQGIKNDYLALVGVREENKRLWDELQECRASTYRYREAMIANVRLRNLLEFKKSSEYPMVVAQVVGKDPSPWFRTVVINRGTNDGIEERMPVVTDNGVVGQIFSVSANYAKVLLAIAPTSAVDVLIQKSRVRGILKGTGSGIYLLEYILKTVDVAEGDHVVTAGLGGLFPTGLPVGIVSRVVKKRRGMFQKIEVTPAVDFQNLEELLVIQKEKPFQE